jgi:putative transposase
MRGGKGDLTTLDAVSPKEHQNDDRSAEAAAAELVRIPKERGLVLTGPDKLLKLFTRNVLETALNEELTEHFGHDQNRADPDRGPGNIPNGTRPNTVLTEANS